MARESGTTTSVSAASSSLNALVIDDGSLVDNVRVDLVDCKRRATVECTADAIDLVRLVPRSQYIQPNNTITLTTVSRGAMFEASCRCSLSSNPPLAPAAERV